MNSNKVLQNRQCRVCMTKQENLFDIDGVLSEVTPNLLIFESLAAVVPQLMFQLNDGLPEQICGSCLNTLQISYQFQQTCIATDKCLRENIKTKDSICDLIKVEPPDLNATVSSANANENDMDYFDIKVEPESYEYGFISPSSVDATSCNNLATNMLQQPLESKKTFQENATQNTMIHPKSSSYTLQQPLVSENIFKKKLTRKPVIHAPNLPVRSLFSRLCIFDIWVTTTGSQKERINQVINTMAVNCNITDAETAFQDLSKRIRYVCYSLAQFWKKVHRKKNFFLIKHDAWLKTIERIYEPIPNNKRKESTTNCAGLSRITQKRRVTV